MRIHFFIPLCLLGILLLQSCKQESRKHVTDPKAVALGRKIEPLVQYLNDKDSCRKAIAYLDSATGIDSDYFLGYENKLMFLNRLGDYKSGLAAINQLIRLRPNAHDLYLNKGIFYEKLNDSASAAKCFEKSLSICNAVLDTMSSENRDYSMLVANKICNQILLGQTGEAGKTFEETRKNINEENQVDVLKQFYTLSRQELLKKLLPDFDSIQ